MRANVALRQVDGLEREAMLDGKNLYRWSVVVFAGLLLIGAVRSVQAEPASHKGASAKSAQKKTSGAASSTKTRPEATDAPLKRGTDTSGPARVGKRSAGSVNEALHGPPWI